MAPVRRTASDELQASNESSKHKPGAVYFSGCGRAAPYDAHNIGEFDAARKEADHYCYKGNDLKRAAYVSRTFEKASFECVLK
jgi:hypothetical protein